MRIGGIWADEINVKSSICRLSSVYKIFTSCPTCLQLKDPSVSVPRDLHMGTRTRSIWDTENKGSVDVGDLNMRCREASSCRDYNSSGLNRIRTLSVGVYCGICWSVERTVAATMKALSSVGERRAWLDLNTEVIERKRKTEKKAAWIQHSRWMKQRGLLVRSTVAQRIPEPNIKGA